MVARSASVSIPQRLEVARLLLLRLALRALDGALLETRGGGLGDSGRARELSDTRDVRLVRARRVRLLEREEQRAVQLALGGERVFSLHPGWLRTDMGGANAALDPATTAESIVELILRESESPGGPAFLDHEGRTLPW